MEPTFMVQLGKMKSFSLLGISAQWDEEMCLFEEFWIILQMEKL